MKPTTKRFFPRGGFSSSQWNRTEQTKYAKVMASPDENQRNLYDLDVFTSQNKSRKGHQFRCGLST